MPTVKTPGIVAAFAAPISAAAAAVPAAIASSAATTSADIAEAAAAVEANWALISAKVADILAPTVSVSAAIAACSTPKPTISLARWLKTLPIILGNNCHAANANPILNKASNPWPIALSPKAPLIAFITSKKVVKTLTPALIKLLLAIPIENWSQLFLSLLVKASIETKVFSNCFCEAPSLFWAAVNNSLVRDQFCIIAINLDCCLAPAACVAI